VTVSSDCEELHRLIDQLTPDQAAELRAHALRLVEAQAPREDQAGPVRRLSFIGIVDGPHDLAERTKDFVAERFRHSS
jgi:hypothetical protein